MIAASVQASRWRFARLLTIAGDAAAASAAAAIASWVRFDSPLGWASPFSVVNTAVPLVVLPALFVGLYAAERLYSRDALLGGHRVYGRIAHAAASALLAVIVLSYFLGGPPVVSRAWLLLVTGLAAGLTAANRFLVRRIIWRLRRRGWFVRRVVIAGANRSGVELAQQLNAPVRHGCEVLGFVDDYLPVGSRVVEGIRVLASPAELDRVVRAIGADEVIVVPQALTWESLQEIVARAACEPLPYTVQLAPTAYDLVTSGLEITHRAYVPLVTMRIATLGRTYALLKGAADAVIALAGLLLALPLFAYALAWRLTGRAGRLLDGEVVFGRAGRPLRMLAFPAELNLRAPLRRVPALLNVLRGELSVVGPRPIALDEAARAGAWRSRVSAMRPGLLGMWRLRTDLRELEELARLDLFYVRNYTIVLDAQILYETLTRMLGWSEAGVRSGFHRWRVESAQTRTETTVPAEAGVTG